MLVLTRKVGGKIQIGDNITIALLELHTTSARIGIEAPPEVRVVRDNAKNQEPKHERRT